jgi:hypothetical protein
VDAPGNVYAGVATADGVTNGVYRVDRDGASERLPGSEAIFMPNALVFNKVGDRYVTDSIFSAVWRIPRGGTAELWLQDDLLVGTGAFGFGVPIGANGIAYRHGIVYVANSEKAHIVRIAVNQDGSPGTPEILVAGDALFGVDGLALDVHGDPYAVNVAANMLLRFSMEDGSLTLLADSGLPGQPRFWHGQRGSPECFHHQLRAPERGEPRSGEGRCRRTRPALTVAKQAPPWRGNEGGKPPPSGAAFFYWRARLRSAPGDSRWAKP